MELDKAKRYGTRENGALSIESLNGANGRKNGVRESVIQGKRAIS